MARDRAARAAFLLKKQELCIGTPCLVWQMGAICPCLARDKARSQDGFTHVH
jgi:hypothetical protein